MAQGSPSWLAIAIGGGGLVGLATLVVNLIGAAIRGRIEGLREQNEALRIHNHGLERQLDEMAKDSEKKFDAIYETIDKIERGEFSFKYSEHIKEVLDLVQQAKQSTKRLSDKLSDCRAAGKWVDQKSESWSKQSVSFLSKEHPKAIARRQKGNFEKEVASHLLWISASLSRGRPRDLSIYESFKNTSVGNADLYIEALNYIKKKRDWGSLTPYQINRLEKMFDIAIERVPQQYESFRTKQ